MTFCVDVELPADKEKIEFDFSYEEILELVANRVLDVLECPYEAEVNLLITDDDSIREINKEQRDIDNSTDVLSFPMTEFETPGDFENADCFNPETGELILGDIVISIDHVVDQAEKYGHSRRREFAFLIAHSMLHLSGYDHMVEDEEKVMFALQEEILSSLGINR